MATTSLFSSLNFRYVTWWLILILYTCLSFYASYVWIHNIPEKFQIKEAYLIASEVDHPRKLDKRFKEQVSLPDWDSAETLKATSLWYLIPLQNQYKSQSKH